MDVGWTMTFFARPVAYILKVCNSEAPSFDLDQYIGPKAAVR